MSVRRSDISVSFMFLLLSVIVDVNVFFHVANWSSTIETKTVDVQIIDRQMSVKNKSNISTTTYEKDELILSAVEYFSKKIPSPSLLSLPREM